MFTQREWVWCGLGNSQKELLQNNTLALMSTDGICIAQPPPIGDIEKMGYDTFLANARLIAAAPDLLNACKETEKCLNHAPEEFYSQFREVWELISKAVAKAEYEKEKQRSDKGSMFDL